MKFDLSRIGEAGAEAFLPFRQGGVVKPSVVIGEAGAEAFLPFRGGVVKPSASPLRVTIRVATSEEIIAHLPKPIPVLGTLSRTPETRRHGAKP